MQMDPATVADRNFKTAKAAVASIATTRGRQARLQVFQSVLSQASAIAPAARGPVLEGLAKSLNTLSEDDKGSCLAELRSLCADMGVDYRKAFLKRLLKQLLSNRDSGSESASSESSISDGTQFGKQLLDQKARCEAVSQLLRQKPVSAALSDIGKLLAKTDFPASDRGVMTTVIMGLDDLDPIEQKQLIEIFDKNGLSCASALGALFQSPHLQEIEALARKGGLSLSALYLGALTADNVAMQKLLRILGRIPLPEALHVYLSEKIGDLRRIGPAAPSIASASRALLMEMISISVMSEAGRCLLVHGISAAGEETVYSALKGGELNGGQDYWAYAHKVIATVIDIGTCHAIVSGNDASDDLEAYGARAGKLLQHETAEVIVGSRKCQWDKTALRKLMLESTDIAALKQAVFEVLDSDLSYEEKLLLLKCQARPVGESTELHVREARFQAAREQYSKRHPGRKPDKNLAYNVVMDSQKAYDAAYEKLTAELAPDALEDIQQAAKMAMIEADNSRLPAMHIAVRKGESMRVKAYLQTVIGFAEVLPAEEIAGFLELSNNGMPLFHYAMLNGTRFVISDAMSVILNSELAQASKISLLESRRVGDKIGAFYLAMSCGDSDRALQFVDSVMSVSEIDDAAKIELLQCPKLEPAKRVRLNENRSKALKKAAQTARGEAERRKHALLVTQFDHKIERSSLTLDDKLRLQTS